MPERILMVIAPDTFRDEEYTVPREVLERRTAEVVVASTRAGACTGRFGTEALATLAIAEADLAGFDALVFVGGGGASVFFDDAHAHRLAREAASTGKVLAAICIAPSTLAHAGLLDGRRATAFESRAEDLVAHGAVWTGAPVEIDGAIVTANGPDAAAAFGMAVADLLGLP